MVHVECADVQAQRSASSAHRIVTLASGLLVAFLAFGFGSWFSGLASWIAFYAGAREQALVAVAQTSICVGFALAIAIALAWYWRRCQRGVTNIPGRAALAACLILPIGNIFWAIFADAIAWHYGADIVRPAFDYAIMYLVLGGILPLTLGVPWLAARLQRQTCREA